MTKIIKPEEFGLKKEEASSIEQVFTPVIAERKTLEENYNDIVEQKISIDLIPKARDLRLKLVKIRTRTNEIHKKAKAFYLAGGRFVDSWKNLANEKTGQMEEKLKEIEEYYINIEKEKLQKLKQKRLKEIEEFEVEGLEMMKIEEMPADVWDSYITGLKEKKKAEERAERKRKREEAARIKEEKKRRAEELKKAAEEARIQAEKRAKIERKEAIEREKAKAKAEREALIRKQREEKEAEERREREAEEAAKVEQERINKDEKIKKWKKRNNYNEETDIIQRNGDELLMYKFISIIKI